MTKSPAFLLHKLVFSLDRSADKLLRAEFGISHKRALFLVVLQSGPMTQHELAKALGYTDPAVSLMLVELAKDGYVAVAPSPDHLRKRIASLTPNGEALIAKAQRSMDARFERLLVAAGVDGAEYGALTDRIYQTLTKITKE